MNLDTETNQDFLGLIHQIQNNDSNAVINIKAYARYLLDQTVEFDMNQKFFLRDSRFQKSKNKQMVSAGRPTILSKQIKSEIQRMKSKKMSNREIAKELKISEGTVRNYLKNI